MILKKKKLGGKEAHQKKKKKKKSILLIMTSIFFFLWNGSSDISLGKMGIIPIFPNSDISCIRAHRAICVRILCSGHNSASSHCLLPLQRIKSWCDFSSCLEWPGLLFRTGGGGTLWHEIPWPQTSTPPYPDSWSPVLVFAFASAFSIDTRRDAKSELIKLGCENPIESNRSVYTTLQAQSNT